MLSVMLVSKLHAHRVHGNLNEIVYSIIESIYALFLFLNNLLKYSC